MSGSARLTARVLTGSAPALREMAEADPVLALLATVAIALSGVALRRPDGFGPVGAVGAATAALVLPPAFAYGAIRHSSGLAALRGAVLLCMARPATGLSLLALHVLAGFAVIASGGVLLVVVQPGLMLMTGGVVAAVLAQVLPADAPPAARWARVR